MTRFRQFFNCCKYVFLCAFILTYTIVWCFAIFASNPYVTINMPEIFQDFTPAVDLNNLSLTSRELNYCHVRKQDLQLQTTDMLTVYEFEDILASNPHVRKGGRWSPQHCVPFQKVAIIVPYRGRQQHLRLLLNRLHPMLRRQRINYVIYVLEQIERTPFNRGMLLNVGVAEALKLDPSIDCFIFHDVDLIPEHDQNIYLCDGQVRHLSSAIDEVRYHVMYDLYSGGVTAVGRDLFIWLNGFSNLYWGWGNEDDDFSARVITSGLTLSRPPEHIGRYRMAAHSKQSRSLHGHRLFSSFRGRHFFDGFHSVRSVDDETPGFISSTKSKENAFNRNSLTDFISRIGTKEIPFNRDMLIVPYHVRNVHELDLFTHVTVKLYETRFEPSFLWNMTHENTVWLLRFYGWLPTGTLS